MDNKREKLKKEFQGKAQDIVNKSVRAFEKLEKDFGYRYNMVVFVRNDDDTWTTTTNVFNKEVQ